MGDVIDGIRRGVSTGYEYISERSALQDESTGKDIVRFNWRPFEVSLVAIPADTAAGVGRSKDVATNKGKCKNCGVYGTLYELIDQSGEGTDEWVCEDCIEEATPEALEAPESVESAEAPRGISVAEFNSTIFELKQKRHMNSLARKGLLGLTEKDAKSFSIVRAVRDVLNTGQPTGFEREMLDEGKRLFPSQVEGQIWIPPDLIVGLDRSDPLCRDLNVTTASQGGGFVQTTVLTPIIQLLRNKMVMQRAGIQVLAGLQGNVSIPRQTGAATAQVVGEQQQLQKSTQAIGQVNMVPHRVGVTTSYSKQLFLQSSVDVETFVRDDMMKVLGIKLDSLVLTGAGGVDPVGILNTTGIGAVAFGGEATWAKAIEFETALALGNADLGRMAYVTSPDVRAKWKTIPKVTASTFPIFLWETSLKYLDAEGEINGYRAFSTNQIPLSLVGFGNWEDDVLGMWGGMDIIVDPYTSAQAATVNVTINTFADNAVRHAASFAWSADSGAQ
jgi:hypothetical protein